jgi:hypothetical protein
MTAGVQADPNLPLILHEVASFDRFEPGDDPYGEHDFGAVTVAGGRYYFKIDYYDASLTYGVDPYEQEPVRVLTIMRADEY